jgi:hypothetical protein
MRITPWETIDSDWASRVPLRFNLSALVTVPDEADSDQSGKYGTLLIKDNKEVFETFISHKSI